MYLPAPHSAIINNTACYGPIGMSLPEGPVFYFAISSMIVGAFVAFFRSLRIGIVSTFAVQTTTTVALQFTSALSTQPALLWHSINIYQAMVNAVAMICSTTLYIVLVMLTWMSHKRI